LTLRLLAPLSTNEYCPIAAVVHIWILTEWDSGASSTWDIRYCSIPNSLPKVDACTGSKGKKNWACGLFGWHTRPAVDASTLTLPSNAMPRPYVVAPVPVRNNVYLAPSPVAFAGLDRVVDEPPPKDECILLYHQPRHFHPSAILSAMLST
jgi:hypothetical protein